MCQAEDERQRGAVHMGNFSGSAPLPIFAQAAQEARLDPLTPLGTLTEATKGAACLPASQKGSDTPTAVCVRACVRLGKVAERCTCVSSVPRVNILSQLHCTSSCVKGAPSVHRRRRMLDIKKKKHRANLSGWWWCEFGGLFRFTVF